MCIVALVRSFGSRELYAASEKVDMRSYTGWRGLEICWSVGRARQRGGDKYEGVTI